MTRKNTRRSVKKHIDLRRSKKGTQGIIMNVGIKSLSGILPKYHTENSARLNVRTYIEGEIYIKRSKISMVPH